MREYRLPCDNSLDYHVFNLVHEHFNISSFAFKDPQDSPQRSFMSLVSIIIIATSVLLILIGVFVQRVVGQVHKHIVQVVTGWLLVRFRAETRECQLVKVYTQWVDAIQEDVKTQVIF